MLHDLLENQRIVLVLLWVTELCLYQKTAAESMCVYVCICVCMRVYVLMYDYIYVVFVCRG